jgi:hypothetical protein
MPALRRRGQRCPRHATIAIAMSLVATACSDQALAPVLAAARASATEADPAALVSLSAGLGCWVLWVALGRCLAVMVWPGRGWTDGSAVMDLCRGDPTADFPAELADLFPDCLVLMAESASFRDCRALWADPEGSFRDCLVLMAESASFLARRVLSADPAGLFRDYWAALA